MNIWRKFGFLGSYVCRIGHGVARAALRRMGLALIRSITPLPRDQSRRRFALPDMRSAEARDGAGVDTGPDTDVLVFFLDEEPAGVATRVAEPVGAEPRAGSPTSDAGAAEARGTGLKPGRPRGSRGAPPPPRRMTWSR